MITFVSAVEAKTLTEKPAPGQVVVIGDDLDDASVWQVANQIGATHVVFPPDADTWITERVREAVEALTGKQETALRALCLRYNVEFDPTAYKRTFDLPTGWVTGQVGPIVVGVSPDGQVHS